MQRLWLALAVGTGACAPAAGPKLSPLDDQVVAVGGELRLTLEAIVAGGGGVDYAYETDMPGAGDRAELAQRPDGTGVFFLRPLGSDVGKWHFDFTATQGGVSDTITVAIEVRSAVGAASAPRFLNLGKGTTLDLGSKRCVELEVSVDDADSTRVTIREEEPRIEGATIEETGAKAARWKWCPSAAQIDADDQYVLHLSADDGDNARTPFTYKIILQRATAGPSCPGDAPVIQHTPENERILVGLTVVAEISDDVGFKRAPLFYYAAADPGPSPDLSKMTQLDTLLLDGDDKSGWWGADVPNPVAASPAGTTATLWYVFVATDGDDPTGACVHTTQSPVYSMTVTSPGGAGGLGLCKACTADAQCGGDNDLCVRVGAEQESFCLAGCEGGCPSGTTCSADPVTSVDGTSAPQCVPTSGTCAPAAETCNDDDAEENDTRYDAVILPLGTHSLMSCPTASGFGDDDWYEVTLDAAATLRATLTGGDASDLDLLLTDEDGYVIASSVTRTSTESIAESLPAARYYVRVKAFAATGAADGKVKRNPYTLEVVKATAAACQDDAGEDDDDKDHARAANVYYGYTSSDNRICANDDDWYRIDLAYGETLVVDLTFAQQNDKQNLDLHLHDADGHDLTGDCSEDTPLFCTALNGQSRDSDEHFEHLEQQSCAGGLCIYYVRVHGFGASENRYDIAMRVE